MFFKRFKSSVGRKILMAVTGFVLFGFVIAHMLGNLQVFLGSEALNGYAEHLARMPYLLWPARVFLLTTLIIHIVTSISLAIENRDARPVPYSFQNTVQASYASRTMVVSGILVFFFIVYHLLHFTFGLTHPQYFHLKDPAGRHDVYSMVVLSFREPLISSVYIAAMFVLCAHLSHGVASGFQSLGLNNESRARFFKILSHTIAFVIFIGNTSIVVAALLKFLPLPPGVQ